MSDPLTLNDIREAVGHYWAHRYGGFTQAWIAATRYLDWERDVEVWNECAEAYSEWFVSNPSPSGIPIDPPRNPYEES